MRKGGDATVKAKKGFQMILFISMIFLALFLGNVCGTEHPAYAGQGMGPFGSGNVTISAGCTPSASGTVLVGSSTEATEDSIAPTATQASFFNTNFTATWAGDCTTETVGTIELYVKGHAGGNCKAYIAASDGTILTNGVSNVLAVEYEDTPAWKAFTMGTPPTITKGTGYKIAYICDTEAAVLFYLNDTGTTTLCFETGGTYASPGALSCDTEYDTSTTVGGMRGKK